MRNSIVLRFSWYSRVRRNVFFEIIVSNGTNVIGNEVFIYSDSIVFIELVLAEDDIIEFRDNPLRKVHVDNVSLKVDVSSVTMSDLEEKPQHFRQNVKQSILIKGNGSH